MQTATTRSATESEPESQRSVVIERVIDAPARLLFEAYTKPEHVMRWFGPPGYPLTHCEMDFREGGTFKFQMTGPDGEGGPLFGGTYLSIVPHKHIQYDNGFLDEKGFAPGRMIVTISFDELVPEKRTKLVVHTLFESVAMKNEHTAMGYVEGVSSTLPLFEQAARDIARTFVVSRTVDAPARLLFEAHAKREHLLKWFVGADGQQRTPFGGKFVEIVANKKIVYENTFERDAAPTMVVTVWLDEARDGKTVLTVSTVFGTDAMMQEHMKAGYESGFAAAIEQLADVAKGLAEKERA